MATFVSVLISMTVILVVAAVARVMWRARASAADGRVIAVTTAVLGGWALTVGALAYRGAFAPGVEQAFPPLGIALGAGLLVMAGALARSRALRRLLGSQADLTRLHSWRLLGGVFVLMMFLGRLPALFALPAALGDVAIGVTAPWMARRAARLRDRRLALWHALGLADLVAAVALGVMTVAGPTQVFATMPTAEAVTAFPLAVIPGFLVPLAATLHGLSLLRLLRDVLSRARALTLQPEP